MSSMLWKKILSRLDALLQGNDLQIWLTPIQAVSTNSGLLLVVPNMHFAAHVERSYLESIRALAREFTGNDVVVELQVGVAVN